MKKQYIKPELNSLEAMTESIIAASIKLGDTGDFDAPLRGESDEELFDSFEF